MHPTDELSLEFTSDRSGSGPLTWAQRAMWNNIRAIAPNDQHVNVTEVLPVPGPAPLPRVLAALQLLVARHDALHTRYPADSNGEPFQEVVPSGALPVTLCRADADLEEQVEDLQSRLTAKRFDIEGELPLRVGLLADDRGVHRVVLCLSHMAVDAWAVDILLEELGALLSRDTGELELAKPPTRQPLEQARFEQEVLAPRLGHRVAKYWREMLLACPLSETMSRQGSPAVPRFWRGTYWSRACASAAGVLAQQNRVSEASVLLGAIGWVMSAYTGRDAFPVWVRMSNRSAPQVQRSVMYLCQNSPVLIECRAQSFSEHLRSSYRSLFRAVGYGQYDPNALEEVRVAVERERPSPVDLSTTINIAPRNRGDRDGDTVDISGLRELTRESHFAWEQGFESERLRMFISVFDGSTLEMLADTCYLPPAQIEAALRGVETLLVDEALGRLR